MSRRYPPSSRYNRASPYDTYNYDYSDHDDRTGILSRNEDQYYDPYAGYYYPDTRDAYGYIERGEEWVRDGSGVDHYSSSGRYSGYDDGHVDRSHPHPHISRSASPTQTSSTHVQSRTYSTAPSKRYTPPTLYPNQSFNSPLTRSSPAPPPVQSTSQCVPDPEYLTTTLQSSTHLPSQTEAPRKLLILDLNGTLLIRSARPISFFTPYDKNKTQRFRAVHPRPYMPTFRKYLFHPHTRKWLDTMVWSSAQPHNVDNMVSKCFDVGDDEAIGDDNEHGEIDAGGEGKAEGNDYKKRGRDHLVAVWARDTLGLTNMEYQRKTQTLKDLTKPWTQLPSPSSNTQTHSAKTTLLLDDSPLKAQLQPFNHVCIPEYVSKMRARDLEVHAGEVRIEQEEPEGGRGKKRKRKNKKEEPRKRAEKGDVPVFERDRAVSESGSDLSVDVSPPSLLQTEVTPQPSTKDQEEETEAKQIYDETLLAVIGVLDEIKHQTNVSGWLRAGGLWGPFAPGGEVNISVGASGLIPLPSPSPASEVLEVADSTKIAGNDATASLANSTSTPSTSSPTPALGTDQNQEQQTTETNMWFEHAPTFEYWARKGRKAVRTLGIEVSHGICG